MPILRLSLLLAGLFLCASCETFSRPAGTLNISGGSDAVQMNANRRAVYFLRLDKDGSRPKMVSEPPPDTALQSAVSALGKISADIAAKSGDAEAKLDVTQTVIQIARATSVTILRDTLFRLAEAYANEAISAAEYGPLVTKVIESVTELAEQETARAAQEALGEMAKADVARAEAQMQLLEALKGESDPQLKMQMLQGFGSAQPPEEDSKDE